jgi:hypothetical protein
MSCQCPRLDASSSSFFAASVSPACSTVKSLPSRSTRRGHAARHRHCAYRASHYCRRVGRCAAPACPARAGLDTRHDRATLPRRAGALATGAFVPYFQPIVALVTGRPVGYEALARWRHPSRDLLRPGTFLPALEAAGLVVPFGWHILAVVCAQVAAPVMLWLTNPARTCRGPGYWRVWRPLRWPGLGRRVPPPGACCHLQRRRWPGPGQGAPTTYPQRFPQRFSAMLLEPSVG